MPIAAATPSACATTPPDEGADDLRQADDDEP